MWWPGLGGGTADPDVGTRRRTSQRQDVRRRDHGRGPRLHRQLGPRRGPADHRLPSSDAGRMQDEGSDAYWATFWDGEEIFWGHVPGFKGLERRSVVLVCNGYQGIDRLCERLNSSHVAISYAVFCLKKKNTK